MILILCLIQINSKKIYWFFGGRIEFFDVFNIKHITKFCFRFNADKGTFEICYRIIAQ